MCIIISRDDKDDVRVGAVAWRRNGGMIQPTSAL